MTHDSCVLILDFRYFKTHFADETRFVHELICSLISSLSNFSSQNSQVSLSRFLEILAEGREDSDKGRTRMQSVLYAQYGWC